MTRPKALSDRAASVTGTRHYFNATAVALDGRGLLILGQPGAGKSALALDLLAFGASLVSDDGVWVEPDEKGPTLVRPAQAPALIEARGIGLLRAGRVVERAALTLVVDLDCREDQRLPPERVISCGEHAIPLVRGGVHPSLAAPVMQMLRFGRHGV